MSKSRQIRKGQPFAKCFVPRGRTSAVIYAVSLKEHPLVTKVGRSARWQQRRRAYDCWNLAPGDAVENFRTYTFTEDWVDLEGIERFVLDALQFPRRFGKEWLDAPFEDVVPRLDEVIEGLGLSFI
jgi:hypothetical protein